MTRRQWSTTREVHITNVMIVVYGPDDSSWHTETTCQSPALAKDRPRQRRDLYRLGFRASEAQGGERKGRTELPM